MYSKWDTICAVLEEADRYDLADWLREELADMEGTENED